MPYTPVELRHVRLGRSLFGYRRRDVDSLLEDVADSFEEVWRERGELTDQVEDLEKHLGEYKDREQLLASTLVAAEKAAAEAKDAARREAELIVAEAHDEARSIVRSAQGERERLFAEARRVEALLRAALGMVEESKTGDEPDEADQADDGGRPWPVHEDTSEFEAILSPGAVVAAREEEPSPEPADEHQDEHQEGDEEPQNRVALPPVTEDDEEPWSAS